MKTAAGQTNAPLLRIKDLSHSFGGLRAVSHVDLSVDKKAIWGIIGPNGAGKTTVFNLITGVYRPEHGMVTLNGEDITGLPSHVIVSKGISRTFQNIRLFRSMTVLDNVITGAYCRRTYPLFSALARTRSFRAAERETTERALSLLDAFGLTNRMHEPAASLPYGMQRKVELSRALVSGPCVLLLDEPGAGLNPSELDGLAQLILRVKKEYDVAVVLIEHRMRLVMKLCDFVKVLNFGETIFDGRPSDLAADASVVKAYFGEDDAASGN
jgi:branched-chain amino acid transport system ATP-binding protein